MICFTVNFFFFEVLEETFTAGIIERISFLGKYGLFLMLTALMSGIVKLESVEGTGNFLMDTMSMMFIPATVGIIESADQLREVLLPFLLIIATSTVIVMAVTGTVAQRMVESGNKKEED